MRAQRPETAAPCIAADAESLPFDDQSFDAAMAVLWLVRDYLPEFLSAIRARPTLAERAAALGAVTKPVPSLWDCHDGFFHCYWRRPHASLREPVRRGTSVWAQVEPEAEQRAVSALAEDLSSGRWRRRNGRLLEQTQAELGARLLIGD